MQQISLSRENKKKLYKFVTNNNKQTNSTENKKQENKKYND